MTDTRGECRDIIGEIVARLRREPCFGRRPWSLYTLYGLEPFITHVLKLDARHHFIPATAQGIEDLSAEQQRQLKQIVDRIDRYGRLVEDWRTDSRVRPSLLEDIQGSLAWWVRRRLPGHWLQTEDLPELVDELTGALKAAVVGYDYKHDFWSWAIPVLMRALRQWALARRSEVAVRALLQEAGRHAHLVLDHLNTTYGIYGIDAEEMVDRALLQAILADDAAYTAHSSDILRWVADALADEVKFQSLSHLEPNMLHDWYVPGNKEMDLRETQKRRQWLETFLEKSPRPRRP